jgi:hypothetical protein
LFAISICTPAMAQICDPVGQPGQWFTTGYATVGWIVAPATIRVEIRQTPLGGGTPTIIAAVFDVNVSPVGSGWEPETGGEWGVPLLEAIADRNDVLVAGGIEVYQPLGSSRACRRMVVNSLPNTRIACRAISTAATALPALPFMPPLLAAAATWPAAPVQNFAATQTAFAPNSYDCVGCGPGTPLGLVGWHIIARPPDWNGVLSDNEEGQFIALPSCLFVLAGDNNKDCQVDLSDFALMAENWLIDCQENPSNPACVHK